MTPLDGSNAHRVAFSERVMAAIASMAMPSPTRSLLEAIRARSGRDALAAITVAWHLATQRDWPLEPRVRARSFALVLAVATILGTGSMVAASAARVIVPNAHRTEILEQRGSIILEPAPAQIAPTSPGRPPPMSVTIPVPMAVPVVVPKIAPVSTVKHPAPASGKDHAVHGGSTSVHDTGQHDGGDGSSADPSNSGDHDDPGTSSRDASDGDDIDHGDDTDHRRDGGDGHQVDDGGTSSD